MNTILTSITNWKIKKEEKNLLSYIIYTVSNQNPTKDNLSLISFSPSLGTENSNFHIISMQFSFFIIFLVLNWPHRTQPNLNTPPPPPLFLFNAVHIKLILLLDHFKITIQSVHPLQEIERLKLHSIKVRFKFYSQIIS